MYEYPLTDINWFKLINNKDNIQLNIYNASLLGQNFEGILLEMYRDWSYVKSQPGGLIPSPATKRINAEILLGSSIYSVGDIHTVRLFIDAGTSEKVVYGMDLQIGLNDNGMELVNTESDYAISVNDSLENLLKVGVADPVGITGSKIFATLRFQGEYREL